MSKSFCFSLFFLFTITYTFAQKNWAQDIHNEEKSLYEIQEAFENYWENKTIGKGKGWAVLANHLSDEGASSLQIIDISTLPS